MSSKEFGRLLDSEEVEFGRIIEEEPKERFRSGAGGKALIRGALKAAEEAPQSLPTNILGEGIKNILNQFFPSSPQPSTSQILIEGLGVSDPEAGLPEKAIEKGIQILPYLLGGEGAIAPKALRALLAGGAGELAKESGLGEIGEAGAELLALGAPGLGKKIVPKAEQRKAIEMLRKRGLTETEIAPLVPSERKSATLSKLGSRGFRTEKAAKKTKEALGDVYSQLFSEGENLPILSTNRTQALQSSIKEKLKKMPSNVRRSIKEDLNDLFSKPVKANDLMNFWQDLNANINWNASRGGKKRLNELKEVLLEGMKEISPELAQDFELTNEVYSKFGKLSKNLQGRTLDSLLAIGEVAGSIGRMFKFGPLSLGGILGTEGARRLASEMLINPRLQNLSQKMIQAALNSKVEIARKLQQQLIKELEKSGFQASDFESKDRNHLRHADNIENNDLAEYNLTQK